MRLLLVISWFICFRRWCIDTCKPNICVSWSTSELRVRLARRLTGLSPPVKHFTDRSEAVLLLWIFYVFVLSYVCYVFVRVCLYVLCGHLLGKGWPLGSRLWCLLWVCHFPIGILGQVWYLILSIPDLCTLTYFKYFSGRLKTYILWSCALMVNKCEFSVNTVRLFMKCTHVCAAQTTYLFFTKL